MLGPHLPPRVRSALAASALVLAVGSLLAACSSSGSGSSSSGGSSSATATATHRGPSCALVTAATIQSMLGLRVGAPVPQVNGPVTVCTYAGTSAAPSTVIVRFETGVTRASFDTAKAGFTAHQEPTADVSTLGDAAYSSTLGAGSLVQNTVVVLKGSTELLISAPAPLDQVEGLARQVLPSL